MTAKEWDLNRSKRRAEQLGTSHSTARNRLIKSLLFRYIKQCGDDICHVCGLEIVVIDELSIEHILPWENRNPDLFWDLNNVTFSHLACNKPHVNPGNGMQKPHRGDEAWCCGCKQYLPFEDFAKDVHRPRGLQGYCRACHKKSRNK